MKQKIFMGVLAAMMFTACSNDELTDVNRDGDEIAFNVVTNLSTRAADVYCNNNLPSSFNVWAMYNGSTYIANDEITKTGNQSPYTWKNQSGTRYWPNTGNVDFYAYVGASTEASEQNYKFKWNNGSNPTIQVNVPTNVAQQKDLLYAVKTGQNKANNSGNSKVQLNFRHALSQIVFQARNENKSIYVEITGVSVCNIASQNTFTFPTGNTDAKVGEHNSNGTIDYNGQNWGTWPTTGLTQTAKYSVDGFGTVTVPYTDGTTNVSLTNTSGASKEYDDKAMLLLPQATTKWDVSGTAGEPDASTQTGSYFLLKCKIWNVADTEQGKQTTDHLLWPASGTDYKDIAIPVTINWEQGKKYIYTFVFTKDGNGGYNPDPEDPDTPEPVLVPITFDVTVDDFVSVDNQNIEMDEPKNN